MNPTGNGGLARVFRSYNLRDTSDGGLLRGFREKGDQDAFAELMHRHSGMVVNAAKAVVGDTAEAEDIAQAVFMTLACKAGSLDGADSIGGWLYHVAVCLARNARQKRQRREAREKEAAMITGPSDETTTLSEAALAALYEEIAGLSESYRGPVILHHLEGKSYEKAAAELGCTAKAFSARLTRAREKLRKGLAGRGVVLGAAALAAALGQSASAAELSAAVVASTCKAAGMLAAGTAVTGGLVSANVAALMEGAMKMLWIAKVKTVAVACAIGLILVGGAAVPIGIAVARAGQGESVNRGMENENTTRGTGAETTVNKADWPDGMKDHLVRFIRLKYDGANWDDGMDEQSGADRNFLERFHKRTGFKVAAKGEAHGIALLAKYPKGFAPPFVYMTGSGDIKVSADEVKVLQAYLADGGMLFADCGGPKWDASFRALMQTVFPGEDLSDIPNDDPLFKDPYVFENGAPPLWHHGGKRALGIKLGGHWAVFYHPGDLNDAWKTGHSGLDAATADRAYDLGVNIVCYAFARHIHAAAAPEFAEHTGSAIQLHNPDLEDSSVAATLKAETATAPGDEVDAMLRQALAHFKEKQYKEAGNIFSRVQQKYPYHPKAPMALVLAGQCQMKLEDWKAAGQTLAVIALPLMYPDDLEKWKATGQPLEKLVKTHSEARRVRPEAMYWLGEACVKLQDYESARDAFKKLTQDYPESQWAKYARGRLTQQEFQGLDAGSDEETPIP